jgi:hypothetical protein
LIIRVVYVRIYYKKQQRIFYEHDQYVGEGTKAHRDNKAQGAAAFDF